MNTEEKAQAYDKALNKIKPLYEQAKRDGNPIWSTYEYLIPELAENEDEKVRKALIEGVRQIRCKGDITQEQMIAYLEKQKEHSMSATEVLARAGLKPYKDGNKWCILVGDNIQEGICGFGDTIDEALYQFLLEVLEKQKAIAAIPDELVKSYKFFIENGRREIEEIVNAINSINKQKEQKPELVQQPPITYTYNSNASRDERLKAALLALLNSDLIKVAGNKFTKQDLIDWVERIPTDKPAEWSEQDEKIIQSLILEVNKYVFFAGIEANKIVSFLKSLRPSWKPSEDEERLIKTSISFLKHFADKGYENAVECIDWLKSKLNGNTCK